MPVGVQVASYVADGLLYLTTKKTLTDHGLSLIANKDCSVWRGLSKGELCREPNLDEIEVVVERAPAMDERSVEVASAFPIAGVSAKRIAAPVIDVDVENTVLAEFETAAGTDGPGPAPSPAADPESDIETLAAGTYLVIGSFAKVGNAERLIAKFDGWPVMMLPADVKGKRLYRVAMGPVRRGAKARMRERLAGQGVVGAWPLEIYGTPSALEVAQIAQEDARALR